MDKERKYSKLAYAEAFNLVPLCNPMILLYDLLFHQRTTNQLHHQIFQMNSPSHPHHCSNQQRLSHIF